MLKDYLNVAIRDGMLSIAVFVTTLLQAVRSPELHHPATVDMLVRLALEAHYSSGLLPIGSLVSFSESPIVVLGSVQDAFALLRTAHSFPMSTMHQLTNSASELVILLLSCVSDMPFAQVSTAQAIVYFEDAHDILSSINLTPSVRQVLEQFVLSLGLLIGDDAKAAREAQMMHTIQMALGKSDILGPSSDTDIISCSLLLHHLVSRIPRTVNRSKSALKIFFRAEECGLGNESNSVAMLVATLRWTSWTPPIFYTQLLLSAFTCLSQCVASSASLWRAFIVGRVRIVHFCAR
jgi:mediator of RNA polymerase II transcription subunit 5